jgi:tRNA (guanosine-2'-O-)-methyltransferase
MDDRELYKLLQEFMTVERAAQLELVASQRTRHITVVLEDLYQTHNASAVLRSCDCFGIQDIQVIENHHRYELNNGIAMGAGKWLDTTIYNQQKDQLESATLHCYETLRSKGYKIAATCPHRDGHTISTLPIDQPIALVFGTEVKGISDEAAANADYLVRIPMYGFTESFNISVAASISLYEITRRVFESAIPWQLSEKEQFELKFRWIQKSLKDSKGIIKRLKAKEQ